MLRGAAGSVEQQRLPAGAEGRLECLSAPCGAPVPGAPHRETWRDDIELALLDKGGLENVPWKASRRLRRTHL